MSDDDDARHTPQPTPPVRLRAVQGPLLAPEPLPPVRLVREFKGPTVADLLCHDAADRLPGRVLSALHALERGDLAAAERALPGEYAPLLAGPGHTKAARRRTALIVVVTTLVVLAAVLAGLAVFAWRQP